MCPLWSISQPPLNIAYLKSSLTNQGYEASCYDLNINLFKKIQEKDIFHNNLVWEDSNKFHQIIHDNQDIFNNELEEIMKKNTLIVGFSIFQTSINCARYFSQKIKEKNKDIIIVWGGPECFSNGNELIKEDYVDFIVKREGEITFSNLVDSLVNNKDLKNVKGILFKENNKIIDTGEESLIKDLDILPFPDFSDFNIEEYNNDIRDIHFFSISAFPIMGSRGCPGQCTFCHEKPFWKYYRSRSGENIYMELKKHSELYKVNNFQFCESLLNANIKELMKMCDLIIENNLKVFWGGMARLDKLMTFDILTKMKKAGCGGLAYGLESGSQKVLNDMKKGINVDVAERIIRDTFEVGIEVHCNLLVGFPSESEDDFEETIKFLRRNQKYIHSVNFGGPCGIKKPGYLYEHPEKFNIKYDELGNWYTPENNILIRYKRIQKLEEEVKKLGFQITLFEKNKLEEIEKKYIELNQKKNKNTSIIKDGKILIFPNVYNNSLFNLWPISYWQGDEFCKEGYTHIVGRDYGHVSYLFKAPEGISKFKVKAKLSSHSKRQEQVPENASEITLLINDIEVETKLINYYWPECPNTEWVVDLPLKKGINTLTFKIKDTAKYKNGITIYYKNLINQKEYPIEIEIE